jgi:hypothetical protein
MLPRSVDMSRRIKQLNRGVERCGTQMHVSLRHAELAVSSKFLDGPCRRATHRQVRAERVTKDVDAVPHVRVLGGELNLRLNDLSRERPAIGFAQNPRSAQVPMLLVVIPDRLHSGQRDSNHLEHHAAERE